MKRKSQFIIMMILCFLAVCHPVCAEGEITTQLDMGQSTIDGIVAELKKADISIATLQGQQEALNSQVITLTDEVSATQSEIDTMNTIMDQSRAELEERMRVMYMFGGDSYLEVLFTSEDLTDFFTRADMVASILKADRQVMDNLKALRAQIEEKTQLLNTKHAMLIMASQSQQSNQAILDNLSLQKEQLLASNTEAQATYENSKYVASGAGGSSSVTAGNGTQSASASDFDTICAIVAHEGGTSYEGSLAVISCVMNRVDSGAWGGSTALGVLTAPGQFASYLDGYYTQYLGAEIPEVRQAVRDCMEGGVRSHPYMSFRSYQTSGSVNIGGNWYF